MHGRVRPGWLEGARSQRSRRVQLSRHARSRISRSLYPANVWLSLTVHRERPLCATGGQSACFRANSRGSTRVPVGSSLFRAAIRQESGGTTHAQLPPVEEIASAGGYDPVRRYARRWSPMPEEALIRFESGTVILLEIKILLGLAQHAVADYEHIQLVAHEAAESVFRCADDRLTAHVEAGVDQHRTPGPRLESREQSMKAGIGRRADGLNAGGTIDMGYRGNFRARNIELVEAEQRLLLSAHGAPPVPPHVGHDQH